jgi:transcription elongation factor Elf1
MNFACAYCQNFTFTSDFILNDKRVNWVYLSCVKCHAEYQIILNTKTKTLELKDVSQKCPKCQLFNYESFWDKDSQKYVAVCEHCGFKSVRDY